MKKGKQLGDFSVKFTSFTVTPGPAGSTLLQGNFEGPTSGPAYTGTIIGTSTFVGGSKSGTFDQVANAYLDNGEQVTWTLSGTYESAGKHHWRTQHVFQLSDGVSGVNEGEIDLAARSWTGKFFEKA